MKWCVWKCFAFFGLALNAAGYPPTDVTTYNNHPYKYFHVSSPYLQFRVRASNYAQIALTSDPQNSNPMIEVIIGWENLQSAIRKNETTPDKVVAETPNILFSNEYRGFWLHWDDGIISVGREGQSVPFMSWKDPEPFPIHFIGLKNSLKGNSASWKIQGLYENVTTEFGECRNTQDAELCHTYCQDFSRIGDCVKGMCECIRPNSTTNGTLYVATGNDLQYQFFPVTSKLMHFKVRAPNDAHIALAYEPQKSQPMVEVFIGGWQNNQSAIRENDIKIDKAHVNTPNILNGDQYRGFWLLWSDDVISVGREGQSIPFMSWQIPKPFPIRYIGFSTGWGASGSWKISDLHLKERSYIGGASTQDTELFDGYCRGINRLGDCAEGVCRCIRSKFTSNRTLYVATDNSFQYKFFPVSSKLVYFNVKAPKDAHIVLTSGPQNSEPMVEIFIGGWENKQSAIRKNDIKPYNVNVDTPDFLNNDEYRSFWLQWDDGIIAVGRAGYSNPFMSWKDPEPFPINFIGLRTAWGGLWKILVGF